ncbi:Cell division coordinator CpoB [Usitatibacter rugosus]|uniref:Cell division coordinator CpoB n=1 Tax=Usitatibacter rugosus TaxID=2732067 RepID=A0A6M4GYT5_9PROT|nr:tetratricopeptide repeat protein [Usitatibacter rugosus]QJR12430.1 Cell division coordinator CpoB [Usitatibacter rugosus]
MSAELQRALALLTAKDHGSAVAAFDAVIRTAPGLVDAHYNRGVALRELRRNVEALQAFETALALMPAHEAAAQNRLAMLLELGRPEAARAGLVAEVARAATPDALTNLGLAEQALGHPDEARAKFESALALDPAHRLASWNLALLDLREGRWKEGFERYDAAWPGTFGRNVSRREMGRPAWRGESLEGRSILLHGDEGLGDTLQGLRFVAAVARQAARTVLEVQRGLGPLARTLATDKPIEVIEMGDTLPATDVHAPLHALPARLGADATSIAVASAYVTPPAERVLEWRSRLQDDRLKHVGLAWRGNPTHPDDRYRSMALARLRPLFDVEGSRLVSLQLNPTGDDVAVLAERGAPDRVGETTDGLADTAGLIAALDLVITVDTSLAHLAGAMGRPVWILLGTRPDWRWLRSGERTAWYPTARLFRSEGDWDAVVSGVRGELRGFVAGGG